VLEFVQARMEADLKAFGLLAIRLHSIQTTVLRAAKVTSPATGVPWIGDIRVHRFGDKSQLTYVLGRNLIYIKLELW